MSIEAGTRIGRYEIQSLLGAGGMGEVYRALDTQLDRTVALKILPAEVASDQGRMRRFVQEARSASALNHQNIITIHEIGESAGAHFMAIEFVEGETLRQHLKRTRISILEALDVAFQVASALAAAHEAGLVHRDVKPENIMVRRDGFVKVLDFGLVKLAERRTETTDTEAPTRAFVNTDAGVVMGTAHYMSPEQARGTGLDERTDIWSLGVVLYEMVAGVVPFGGGTPSDVIASILKTEQQPLSIHAPGVPAELERIVGKALEKDREDRYQGIKDLLVDLRHLKKRLDFEAELERSAPPDRIGNSIKTQAASLSSAPTLSFPHPSTGEVSAARATSSAKSLVSRIRRHKLGAALVAGAIILTVGGLILLFYKLPVRDQNRQENRQQVAPLQNMKINRLTTTGQASNAAISPDGKYVVHVAVDGGQQSLWVRHIGTGSNVQIVPPSEGNYNGLTFSPDGGYIYYVKSDETFGAASDLYRVPVLGGDSRKLIEGVAGPVSFSPDGKQLVFARGGFGAESALILANADGSGERKLVARNSNIQPHETFLMASWSPDGKTIASSSNLAGVSGRLLEVRVEDGAERPITSERWRGVGQIAWLSDGSGMVLTATQQAYGLQQIWYVSYPEGQARRITNDLNDYRNVSLTADSNTLITVQTERNTNIWVAPGGDANRAKQITTGTGKIDGLYGLVWLPDDKIVYASNADGEQNIWVVDAEDAQEAKQLTTGASSNFRVTASPDGRYIFFSSSPGDYANIWRINADGSDLRQITNGKAETLATVSPDGRWVIYTSFASPKHTLWRLPVEGGESVQLTNKFTRAPTVSPDGKLIACWFRDDLPDSPIKLAVIPFEGGDPVKLFDFPRTVEPAGPFSHNVPRWSADGRALLYMDTRDGISNIWSQPLEGGPARQVTDFKSGRMFAFDYSRDGRLAFARGQIMSDVVMISNFR
ncbi:MAG TPA: WD40 repeat domain-containing serine/threonine protein kinase [Pyrinomonadaceae bacterium]